MADFVKDNDLEFVAQLQQMKDNLPTFIGVLGLSPTEVALATTHAEAMAYIVLRNNMVPGFKEDWTKLRDQVRYGIGGTTLQPFPPPPDVSTPPVGGIPVNIEDGYRKQAGRIKSSPGYTPGIGESVGIVIPSTEPDYSTYKPEFKLQLAALQVLIIWTKVQSQGVNIYKKIDSGPWFFLKFDGSPNYLDTSALPPAGTTQQWSYRLRYVKNDVEIGEWSNDVEITVSGA